MNDFLQSLRNGKTENQRIPMTRKTYNNVYQHTNQRFHSANTYQTNASLHMKRQPLHNQSRNQISSDDRVPSLMMEAVETLCSHMETLSRNQDNLINAQERTADMLERQAIAMEKIAEHLFPVKNLFKTAKKTDITSHDTVEYLTPLKSVTGKRKNNIKNNTEIESPGKQKRLEREEIMGIIYKMRKEGAIFDQIAKHLIALGQPTFSGRGEWHAQTIHRLCAR